VSFILLCVLLRWLLGATYRSGEVLHSSHKFSEADVACVLKSGPVRCTAVSHDFRYLLTSGDDKLLKLWAVNGLKLLSER